MELTRALLRFSAGRPHVLLAEVPGGTAARLAVEAELRRRDWPTAESPAGADVLVLAGPAGTRLMSMVNRLWRQVSEPRVFVHVDGAAVSEVLDDACRELAVGGRAGESRTDEEHDTGEPGEGSRTEVRGGDGGGGGNHGGEDTDGGGHGNGMEMPAGLGMADRGADRDGLALDRLHVPLGPLLPDWPAGLIVHTVLQGDVVQQTRVEFLRENGSRQDFWYEPRRRAEAGQQVVRGELARYRAAAYLDGLTAFLRVAGWADPATVAARLRDELLAGARSDRVVIRFRRLARRLHRARTLRWLTDGVGVLPSDKAEAAGLGGAALRASRCGGDVTARWWAWLAEIERILPNVDNTGVLSAEEVSQAPQREGPQSTPAPAVLPDLLEGTELAAARLIVASLGPDITAPSGRTPTGVADD